MWGSRVLWLAASMAVNSIINVEPIYRKHIAGKSPRVLEVATGFGVNTGVLLRIVESVGGRLTSIDIDPKSVGRAGKIFKRYVEKKILVLDAADARSLPYADGSFDYVVSHMTMHHIDDVERALDEMVRVLKPGGKIIVVDLNPSIVASMIPGHGREKLDRVRTRVKSYVGKRAEIIEDGVLRLSYYIVALHR